jgi:hypothetical protein
MVFFDDDERWHEGVVVMHEGSVEDAPYIIFYEVDDQWERVDVPDPTIVFQKGAVSAGQDPRIKVTRDMLLSTLTL